MIIQLSENRDENNPPEFHFRLWFRPAAAAKSIVSNATAAENFYSPNLVALEMIQTESRPDCHWRCLALQLGLLKLRTENNYHSGPYD